MKRYAKSFFSFLVAVSFSVLFTSDLGAFTIIENKMFSEGPFLFKIEVQVYGSGSAKKNPMRMTSLKVKIKNDRASSQSLTVKNIRAFMEPQVYQDIETKGYPIAPSQWVTKYYRLSKGKQPILGENASIEVDFESFKIKFHPREKKFQGPIK